MPRVCRVPMAKATMGQSSPAPKGPLASDGVDGNDSVNGTQALAHLGRHYTGDGPSSLRRRSGLGQHPCRRC